MREWQDGFNPNNGELVWYVGRSKTSKITGVGVHRWVWKRGHSSSLGLHTTVVQAEIYAIKACVGEHVKGLHK
jgi:hypothetical protein